jgi:hypothetical protein
VCSKFIFLHREKAKARVADSAINTEVESCMKALIKIEKGGVSSVLTMKMPNPANLGVII